MKTLVEDTLHLLEPEIKYTQKAVELVLGTGAHESGGWKYKKQIGGGPALSCWQIEPFTFNDIVNNFLKYKPAIESKIKQICGISSFNSSDLLTNDRLAICICRIAYYRQKEAIPETLEGWAYFWKKYYNTIHGKGTPQQFIDDYNMYVSNI